MKKSSLILVIVLVIVAAAAIVFWSMRGSSNDENNTEDTTTVNDNTNSGESTDQASGTVVTYDGNSFSPETLTINVGDTVTFRNDSSTEVWPASDDHPTHTNLSGFDPQRGLEPGEDYSFTFEESGDWGYHNHLSPGQTGIVIVE